MVTKETRLDFQFVRLPDVIRIAKGDKLPAGDTQAIIPRPGKPPIAFMPDGPDPGVLERKPVYHLPGTVRRAIVNNY
jgi:hypothetical protein